MDFAFFLSSVVVGAGVVWLLFNRRQQIKQERTNAGGFIKVVSYNVYLVPSFVVKKLPAVHTCKKQGHRSKELGKFTKEYDLVLLQEFWGSHVKTFVREVEETHHILHRHWFLAPFFPEFVNEYIDTLFLSRNQKLGGLNFIVNKDFEILLHKKRAFEPTDRDGGAPKGVAAVLLNMSPVWTDCFLLSFNLHLFADPTHFYSPIRSNQLKEVHSFISETLEEITKKFPQIDSNRICVTLSGDFNIASTTEQYKQITKILGDGIRDLYSELHPNHHESVHFTYHQELNSYVCQKEDEGRIDYIFSFDSFKTESGSTYKFNPVECSKAKVVTQEHKNEISDHWGVEAHIRPTSYGKKQ